MFEALTAAACVAALASLESTVATQNKGAAGLSRVPTDPRPPSRCGHEPWVDSATLDPLLLPIQTNHGALALNGRVLA